VTIKFGFSGAALDSDFLRLHLYVKFKFWVARVHSSLNHQSNLCFFTET